MKEYIELKAAVELAMQYCLDDDGTCSKADRDIRELLDELEAIPAADVVPVVRAYWIPQKENHEFKEAWMKCSVCGYPVSRWTGNTNFCPNCGAKMDGERKE